jgi:hypothetical protein
MKRILCVLVSIWISALWSCSPKEQVLEAPDSKPLALKGAWILKSVNQIDKSFPDTVDVTNFVTNGNQISYLFVGNEFITDTAGMNRKFLTKGFWQFDNPAAPSKIYTRLASESAQIKDSISFGAPIRTWENKMILRKDFLCDREVSWYYELTFTKQ